MDFLRVAVELASPVRPGSLVGDAGEGKGVGLAGTCKTDREFWKDALSPPEPDDESLIDTASPYGYSERSAETEHRQEDAKKSGVTDQVQAAAMLTVQLVVQPVHSGYGGLDPQAESVVETNLGRIQAIR
jgi:hypothetical protein